MSCQLSQQNKKTASVRSLTSACLMTVTFLTASVFAKDRGRVMQIAEVKHDKSLSLRDLESSVASPATTAPRRVMPLLLPHPVTAAASVQIDTALQNVDLPFVSASPGLNFEGLGQGQFGFVVNAAPPTQMELWAQRSTFSGSTVRLLYLTKPRVQS
jgi:hypothetical protein